MVYLDEVDSSCLVVKSTNENWVKETGNSHRIKNNTYRFITKTEQAMNGLEWDSGINWLMVEHPPEEWGGEPGYSPLMSIKIKNNETNNVKKYDLTDITRIDETSFIFTYDLFNEWYKIRVDNLLRKCE